MKNPSKPGGRKSRMFHADIPPFTPLVNELLLNPEVSANAKIVWAFVQYQSQRQDGDRWNSIELSFAEIQEQLGIGERPLRAAVKEAVAAGWLETWRRGQGVSNAYRALARTCETQVQEPAEPQDPRARASTGESNNKGKKGANAPPDASETVPAVRKRDLPFDAMAEATGSDPHLEGSRIAKAVNELRKHPDYEELCVQLDKEQAEKLLAASILQHGKWYREHFGPDITCSPQALVLNWRRVDPRNRGTGGPTLAEREAEVNRQREERGEV